MDKELIYKALRGNATVDEELLIAEWYEKNPVECQKMIDEAHFYTDILGLYGDQVKVEMPLQKHFLLPWRRIGLYSMRVAAVVLLFAGGGYFIQQQTYNSIANQMNSLTAPLGQRMELTLSDGSHIQLNAGSQIEYPVVFKKNIRKVRVSGEAMFEVQSDSQRPFVVETFATNIEVLGTKFNVNADEKNNRFSTTLLQGQVKITNLLDPNQSEIIMKPNDIVNLSNGRLTCESLKDSDMLCWTDGLINISGYAFGELMSKFEQVFDVRIIIARKSLPDISKISGKIRVNDGIENALRILQYTADFSFDKDEEENIVTIR